MQILITNDDGILSPGLWALAAELKSIARVVVVAPDREQSASGTAVSLRQPLRVQKIPPSISGVEAYSVEGTPCDSVILALGRLIKGEVNLVVSGINQGYNLGDDILISGTVGAALQDGELCAFFEYHTKDIALARFETLVRELADGSLEHARILAEGGHGAYTRRALGFEQVEIILATGPKRSLIRGSSLPIALGAPLGDNMMTGTVGLLEAIRRRKGLEPMDYS